MIKCLYGGCPKTFIEEEIRAYVSSEIYSKYRKFKMSQLKLNNPNINYVNCPTPDCEEIVDYEIPADPKDTLIECNIGHKFCAKCKTEGWHKKGKCKTYDHSLISQIQSKSDGSNYKQCPQCSIIIEKNEGCNHMKCVNCQMEFCWLCMNKYSNEHYSLYNFTGCPGMRFSK